jgi:hypothetical protein
MLEPHTTGLSGQRRISHLTVMATHGTFAALSGTAASPQDSAILMIKTQPPTETGRHRSAPRLRRLTTARANARPRPKLAESRQRGSATARRSRTPPPAGSTGTPVPGAAGSCAARPLDGTAGPGRAGHRCTTTAAREACSPSDGEKGARPVAVTRSLPDGGGGHRTRPVLSVIERLAGPHTFGSICTRTGRSHQRTGRRQNRLICTRR